MRRMWAVGLIMLAGCGDPDTSRMAVGSRAMVIGHYKEDGRHGATVHGIEGMVYPQAEDGTMVKVVGDDADLEHDWSTREVTVRILDGPLKERTGTITRWSLRPE